MALDIKVLDKHIDHLLKFKRVYKDFWDLFEKTFQNKSTLTVMDDWTAWLALPDNDDKKKELAPYIEMQYDAIISALAPFKTPHGVTALLLAASHEYINFNVTAQAMLTQGADVNATILGDKRTAVFRATEVGNHDIVETCIQYHANLDAPSEGGYTPLDIAKHYRYTYIYNLLTEAGATKENSGITLVPPAYVSTVPVATLESIIGELVTFTQLKPCYFNASSQDTQFFNSVFNALCHWNDPKYREDKNMPRMQALISQNIDNVIAKLANSSVKDNNMNAEQAARAFNFDLIVEAFEQNRAKLKQPAAGSNNAILESKSSLTRTHESHDNNNTHNDQTVMLQPLNSGDNNNNNAPGSYLPPVKTDDTDENPKTWFETVIDYNNRQLFEGFFDFFFHLPTAWKAYSNPSIGGVWMNRSIVLPFQSKGIQFLAFLLGFALRAALLPVTSLVYATSRMVTIVSNGKAFQHNPKKTVLMRIATIIALTTLLSVGFLTPAFTAQGLQLLSAAFGFAAGMGSLGAVATGAMIAGTLMVIGFATLLHTAKKIAQGQNAKLSKCSWSDINENVTAPKHDMHPLGSMYKTKPTRIGDRIYTNYEQRGFNLKDFDAVQAGVLRSYYADLKKPAICGESFPQQAVKTLLTHFEEVVKRERDDLDQDSYNKLVTKTRATASWALNDSKGKLADKLEQFEVVGNKLQPKNYQTAI